MAIPINSNNLENQFQFNPSPTKNANVSTINTNVLNSSSNNKPKNELIKMTESPNLDMINSIPQSGKITQMNINFSRIAPTVERVNQKDFLDESSISKEDWVNLKYKIRDDGNITIYKDDTPIGFTDQKGIDFLSNTDKNTEIPQINTENKQNSTKPFNSLDNSSSKTYENITLSYDNPYDVPNANRLTASKGKVEFNDHTETYYSETVLPGGGLDIPGRHVAKDGTIRDKDGFICVASDLNYLAQGETLMTSLGPAKVYDSGCDFGTIDIYVNINSFKQN